MRRLEPCVCIDTEALIFSIPPGKIEAVFDGPAELDGECAPKIDEIGRRMKLRYVPVFDIRALVQVGTG
jgi:hypothetical protein